MHTFTRIRMYFQGYWIGFKLCVCVCLCVCAECSLVLFNVGLNLSMKFFLLFREISSHQSGYSGIVLKYSLLHS